MKMGSGTKILLYISGKCGLNQKVESSTYIIGMNWQGIGSTWSLFTYLRVMQETQAFSKMVEKLPYSIVGLPRVLGNL